MMKIVIYFNDKLYFSWNNNFAFIRSIKKYIFFVLFNKLSTFNTNIFSDETIIFYLVFFEIEIFVLKKLSKM